MSPVSPTLNIPSEGCARLAREFFAVIKPSPRLPLAQWADEKRVLSREGSAEPGRWNTARAEYQRGIMNAVTDEANEKVVFQKGTQVGWTEIVNNTVAYFVDQDPSPLLVIQPTVELAEAWSKERLSPMIRDNPVIVGKFRDARSRDSGNTLRHKEFEGGYVAIVGANAPAGLAARPIRVVIADEVDRYPISAGTEGDPLKLAEKRQATFWNRKTLLGSAPTIKDTSVIEREFKRSDMRRFFVPCPHCKAFQTLRWEQVKFDEGTEIEVRAESACYQCEECGTLWNDAERWAAIAQGEWRATAPFTGTAGFHLSQFYSPWVKLKGIVKEFLEAQGNPNLLQVWTNTVLAETWTEQGETIAAEGLRARVEAYGPEDLPDEIHYATAGVDVQGDRLEVEIVGWGTGDESWGMAYRVIYGDPAQQDVWEKLDALLLEKYWTTQGRLVRVRAAAIDTGGHHGAQSITFCRRRLNRHIYPIKGASGPRPVWPKRASKTANTKDNIYLVGVDTAKDAIYGRWKITKPGPGYCHLPEDYDDDWFEQATSESVVTRYRDGRPYRVWILPGGKRNEALDCRVYAFAARMSLDAKQTRPSEVKIDKAVIAEPALVKEVPAAAIIAAKPRGRRMRSRGIA